MHKEEEEVYSGDGKKQKNEQVVLQLPDVPLSIIYEILSWLPVEDILRCRCVCKPWRDLTKHPCFIELQCRRSQISQHPPFVVIIDGGRCLFRNISGNANRRWGNVDIPEKGWEAMQIPDGSLGWEGIGHNISVDSNSRWRDIEIPDGEISDGVCVASCNGFICISQHRPFQFHQTPSIVYNPITKEKIRLPKFDQFESQFQCRFGFDETSHRYKLILDFYLGSYEHGFHLNSQQIVVPIITVGVDNSWRMVDLPCDIIQVVSKRKCGGFFFNGGFHWLFTSNKFLVEGILTLDIITEKFQTTIFSPPLQIDHHYQELLPIQFGNSIDLLHQNSLDDGHNSCRSKVIKIWKILGAKPDGSCDYQFKTLNFPGDPYTPFNRSYRFQLLAVLSNGDFLFNPWDYFGHHLVLYDQQKDETSYFVDMGIRVRDKYKHVEIGTFVPTLMSISPHGH